MVDRGEILAQAEELDLHPSKRRAGFLTSWAILGSNQ